MPKNISDGEFQGSGSWAVILGGSSGFGLATAKRLAKAGLNLVIGHKDLPAAVESQIKPQFEEIRRLGVELFSLNGNLMEDDARVDLLDEIERRAGRGKVHLFLHSIAAGSCKPAVDAAIGPDLRKASLKSLAEALGAEGVTVTEAALQKAINAAFHEKGCDALFTLADSRIPLSDEILSEEDIAKTISIMGFDYLLWGRELLKRGLLAKDARLVALTSEGSELAWRGYAAVSAAKSTLEAVCRSMAVEMAPHGVRSFLVQAGITETAAGNAIPGFDLMKAQARLRNPFRRLTRPEDVAEAIFGLCLPSFRWVNGAVIRVDGGEAISGGAC